MTAPAPEVDIPSTSTMVLACYACLGTRWEGPTRSWTVSVDGVPVEIKGDFDDDQWHCGDCGSHTAQLVSQGRLDDLRAQREGAAG